jgi:very-short-patch-repair endonuclease
VTKRQLLPAGPVIRSRALRRNAGEPERRLWQALRSVQPATKFRRQVPFGIYHADFRSHAARLIIEVDGDDHAMRLETDAVRTRFLQDEGYRVIRFANAEVMQNLEGVVAVIVRETRTQKGRP